MEDRINYTWEVQKATRLRDSQLAFDTRTRQLDAEAERRQNRQNVNDAIKAYDKATHPRKIPLTRKERWQLLFMILVSAVISAAGVYFLIAEALHQIEVGLGKTFGY